VPNFSFQKSRVLTGALYELLMVEGCVTPTRYLARIGIEMPSSPVIRFVVTYVIDGVPSA
jgi:hypothetical protein